MTKLLGLFAVIGFNAFGSTLPELVNGTYVGGGGCVVTVANSPQNLRVAVRAASGAAEATVEFPPEQITIQGTTLTGFRNASEHEEILQLTFDAEGFVHSATATDKNFGHSLTETCTGLLPQQEAP